MKYLKMLVLASAVAMALTALAGAGTASATALYSGSTVLGAGATIDFSATKNAVLVDTEGGELDKCSTSTLKGKLSTGTTGTIEELTWGSCTFPTSTITKGKLEVVSTGGTNGEVKADATIEVTINTVFFGSCIYGVTNGTKAGTVAGNPATFTANAVAEKFSGSNFACPETSKWTGTYSATEPAILHVEESGGEEEEGIALKTTPSGAFNFFVGVEQTKSLTLEGTKSEVVTATGGGLESFGGGSPPPGLDFQSWGCIAPDRSYSLSGSPCTLTITNTTSTPAGTYYLRIRVDQGTKTKDKYISIHVS